MSDLERDSELREFESAGRLYSGKLISDRFTHGSTNDEGLVIKEDSKIDENFRRRISSEWAPHPVVCKRFNIRPPNNVTGTTLQSVADTKKKPKFSVFDFLKASSSSKNLVDLIESNAENTHKNDDKFDEKIKYEVICGSADKSANLNIEPIKNDQDESYSRNMSSLSSIIPTEDEEFKEPENKMDLFKAIFLDTDEESGDEDKETIVEKNNENERFNSDKSKNVENINILRNTSPPRGIFANLDLDKLSNRNKNAENTDSVLKITEPPESIFTESTETKNSVTATEEVTKELPENCYGPILPTVSVDKPKNYVNLKLDVSDDHWVEKPSKEKHRKSRHHHHKKKHKKEKKREKHKKKKKKYSSDSESSSD